METAGDDEKKPFDAEMAGPEDNHFPDPDETMTLKGSGGQLWMVKIPKYLMERWAVEKRPGIPLANVRLYKNPDRFFIGVPPDGAPLKPLAVGNTPTEDLDWYQLEIVNQTVANQYAVAQRMKAGTDPRARIRESGLVGNIFHEAAMKPLFDSNYRARVKARNEAANTPLRTIQMMEDHVSGGQGAINRMASGMANGKGFSDLVRQKSKPAKGQFERMARMPRNQLLDVLFKLFQDQDYWPIRALRERTQQPEVYLKEVLSEIATLHRSGEHAGSYELREAFTENGVKGEGMNAAALYAMPPKTEYDEEEEEDDDEDDMEEVA